jgi:hypothetical protein
MWFIHDVSFRYFHRQTAGAKVGSIDLENQIRKKGAKMKKFLILLVLFMPALACTFFGKAAATSSSTNTPYPTYTALPAVAEIEGTTWAGMESDGNSIVYEFLSGGILKYTSPTGTFTNGTWHQYESAVYMETNDHYAEILGFIVGETMTGNAWNVTGYRWEWTITLQ